MRGEIKGQLMYTTNTHHYFWNIKVFIEDATSFFTSLHVRTTLNVIESVLGN